jgi:raffinose/stachyose/melibiose transport system permease protein
MHLVGTSRQGRLAIHAGLGLLSIVIIFPFASAFMTSMAGGGFRNYLEVIQTPQFFRFLFNSGLVSFMTIVIVVVLSTLAAFAFSKLELPAKNVLFTATLIGLVIPLLVLLVPVFFLVRSLGLIDTYWAVVIPRAAFLLPPCILIMKGYLDGVPNELIDAATIDGADSLGLLRTVIVPVIRPIVAVIALISFLSVWNEYFLAIVFMQKAEMQLVTQVPFYFQQVFFSRPGHIFAALILISVPVVLVYARLRGQIETGIVAGIGK